MARAFRRAKLAQRLGFDLPDPFARDVELLTDLLESVLALAADAEAQPDHFLLLRRQGLQNVGGLIAHVGVDDCIHGGADPTVFDEIAKSGFAIPAHWRLQRYRVARNGLQL